MGAHYLGDGLYVRHDGWQYWLFTQQGNEVALEPSVLNAFFQYVEKISQVKISVEQKEHTNE